MVEEYESTVMASDQGGPRDGGVVIGPPPPAATGDDTTTTTPLPHHPYPFQTTTITNTDTIEKDESISWWNIIIFNISTNFFWNLIQGGYGRVNFEYTEKMGVSIFFQTITTLVVGPATGYAALYYGYYSDSIDSHRYGRRKPVLLPLMVVACLGLLLFFAPPESHKKFSSPTWFFASNALYQVTTTSRTTTTTTIATTKQRMTTTTTTT